MRKCLGSTIALIGNPNTGKTTLFNTLTGLKARVGNYPGVTVEQRIGALTVEGRRIDLVDLPGTYSLAAQSPDEMIVVDLLLGQRPDAAKLDGICIVVDASNLQRNLYLVSQLIECGLPLVIALNMMDVAHGKGICLDAAGLSRRLGVPVVPIQANTGAGLPELRRALTGLCDARASPALPPLAYSTAFQTALAQFERELREATSVLGRSVRRVEAQRILIDIDGFAAERFVKAHPTWAARLDLLRKAAANGTALSSHEATTRYGWVRQILCDVVTLPRRRRTTWSDRIDRVLTHRIGGTAIFVVITLMVFQAIYTWAAPLMDGIDAAFGAAGEVVGAWLPAGPLRSLIVDGVINGVGSVLVFLPQIAILFFFIALLEDCGYMARAAFLMDKLFARIGLSGKSFIPLLSSFACAVPGIMAARTIENRRDRLATIVVAPLMSCSARLPVYTIMIAAFIPATPLMGNWLGLQGLTLFAMHAIGLLIAIPIVWGMKRSLLKGATPPFVMELPSYKRPSLTVIGYRVYDRARAFVRRAGTIIFAMTIVIWACSYFPRPKEIGERYAQTRQNLVAGRRSPATAGTEHRAPSIERQMPMTDDKVLAELNHAEAAEYLQASALGTLGHWIEPAVRPLGWDWRIGMAALASFPAREVVIAVLGTIYNLGNEVDAASMNLRSVLGAATWPDGRPVFTIPVALSVMIFFALCCQCGATVATIRRETNSWRWAWFTFGYMTVLAYVGAFVTYQVATKLSS